MYELLVVLLMLVQLVFLYWFHIDYVWDYKFDKYEAIEEYCELKYNPIYRGAPKVVWQDVLEKLRKYNCPEYMIEDVENILREFEY